MCLCMYGVIVSYTIVVQGGSKRNHIGETSKKLSFSSFLNSFSKNSLVLKAENPKHIVLKPNFKSKSIIWFLAFLHT